MNGDTILKRIIYKVKFQWHDCSSAFAPNPINKTGKIPLFSTGGGSYVDFEWWYLWWCQKHFYFYKWCFLSVKYVAITNKYLSNNRSGISKWVFWKSKEGKKLIKNLIAKRLTEKD